MEDNENPYQILGVERTATQQEIKAAYRKLALKHHPDKIKSSDHKQEATLKFAKISNAYELLGDPAQRQRYDAECSARVHHDRPHRSKQARRSSTAEEVFHHAHFHDPFRVFEAVFRDEFGSTGNSLFANLHARHFGGVPPPPPNNGRNGTRQPPPRRSPFEDPFFGGAGLGGGGMFGNDPFFGGAGLGGVGRDPFLGGGLMGGHNHMFAAMNQQMNQMMNMHHMAQPQQQQQQHLQADPYNSRQPQQRRSQQPQRQQPQTFVSFSSSTSSSNFGPGQSSSVTTTTRIVNGQKQTVTERIVQNPDGTLQRQVQQQHADFPQPQRRPSSNRPALEAAPSSAEAPRRSTSKKKPALFKRKRRDSSKSQGSNH